MSIEASGDSGKERADDKNNELIFVYILPHRLEAISSSRIPLRILPKGELVMFRITIYVMTTNTKPGSNISRHFEF